MKTIDLIKKTIPFLLLGIALTFSPLTKAQANTSESTVNTASLHVRSQPWMGNNTISYVNRGDRVGVISANNGWCAIQYVIRTNGTRSDFNTAYVACNYLTGGTLTSGGAYGGPENATAGTERTVNTASLRVRSQPWMNNNTINYVNRGDRVGIISEDNGWCAIQYVIRTNGTRTDFNKAYVACGYLTGGTPVTGEAYGGPENVTAGSEKNVNTAALNVRSQPWIGNNIINHVNRGDRVGIISADNGWCAIQYVVRTNGSRTDFSKAYVACSYLTDTAVTAGTPTTGEAYGGPENVTAGSEKNVNTAALNVRSQPWIGNNIINHVNRGDRVGIISADNGWCAIQYVVRTNGTRTDFSRAYVACSYLTDAAVTAGIPTTTGEAYGGPENVTAGAVRTVNTTSLHVRSQPQIGNNSISYVNRGDRVGVISEDNGWCAIQYVIRTNGTRTDFSRAYVSCRYLGGTTSAKVTKGTGATGEAYGGPENVTAGAVRTVNTASLHVRSQPQIGNNSISYVNRGDRVGVISEDNGWCAIQYVIRTNGTRTDFSRAYVSCRYLELIRK